MRQPRNYDLGLCEISVIMPANRTRSYLSPDLSGTSLLRIVLPTWYVDNASTISFAASGYTMDNQLGAEVYDHQYLDDPLSILVAKPSIALDPAAFCGCRYVQIISSNAPPTQQTILLVTGQIIGTGERRS